MGKKAKTAELGRALNRKQLNKHADKSRWNTSAAQQAAALGRHTSSASANQLASVLDATDLEELMLNATLANQSFAAQRQPTPLAPQSVVVVTPLDGPSAPSSALEERRRKCQQLDHTALRIPRRPAWNVSTTYQELMSSENDAFLEWRRSIADLEEQFSLASSAAPSTTLTPFEKNLEVWRQLWRVVERSDIVLQIVDARNPLLFLCDDLVRYVVDEMNRSHLVIMNKADLLSPDMISQWKLYFERRGIDVIFFSAFKASVGETVPSPHVIGAEQLIARLNAVQRTVSTPREDGRVVVGLCGYPNVGKSSTINVLLETAAQDAETLPDSGSTDNQAPATTNEEDKPSAMKRVAVSSTPGKTKHFQTLMLTSRVILCDCPGLVFPNFSSSKAELICAGVLSIDNMRGDYLSPVSLIALRVPAAIFEAVYGIRFADSDGEYVSATTLLDCHARARGFMTDHGRADMSRSARVVLKDFVNGRLVYAHGPNEGGESGMGAGVFAKKGQLMYERSEAREKASQARAAAGGLSPEGTDLAEDDDTYSGPVRAIVSATKKMRGKEFVRLERAYFPTT